MPRGGFRSNAGRKKKSKEQKILEGTYKEHAISTENLPAPVIRIEVVDNDVPSLKEYMTRTQKNGNKLPSTNISSSFLHIHNSFNSFSNNISKRASIKIDSLQRICISSRFINNRHVIRFRDNCNDRLSMVILILRR